MLLALFLCQIKTNDLSSSDDSVRISLDRLVAPYLVRRAAVGTGSQQLRRLFSYQLYSLGAYYV